MGRASWAGALMLWAVRGGHGCPVDSAHMGRAAKLGHRACRRLGRIALRLGRRGYGRRPILLRSVRRTLLVTERAPSHASWKWLPWSTRRGRWRPRYAIGLTSRISGAIRRRAR
jgi:hypothetical protein